ncbi:hypothetical protein JIN85_00645 [Luteolibacter pohnpeiensis]|uniref:Uncharacterized protein n=1 Tax=Luteolibacter pohnpeiensis TaxID=454153 RepID=A0A934VUM0_9BACT|nr:hypothetical protein [Luteolibacter pohnpeiensis]MBK1880898.1 hypothetical protein [Luteolibacter pohnpeiensis]
MDDIGALEWTKRLLRWIIGLILLPICWVTTWTFLSRFSYATVHQGFWQTPEFWYFATGILLMVGWFWSGLLRDLFLYLYVLGHELTHAIFVIIHFGKVTDFHVSTSGGYITTNKTNLMIALSPYFVPFWSAVVVLAYLLGRLFFGPTPELENLLYVTVGYTWAFHMLWTLWMLPRDQPDLQEHGVFLSLIIIYLANLLVLVALLCLADAQLDSFSAFGREWIRDAATWGDMAWRWANELARTVQSRVML